MSAPAPSTRRDPEVARSLMHAADAIADMAGRVQLNGPEAVYASEKLAHALYKCAEALALCGAELEEAVTALHRGYRHGRWLRDGEER